MLTVDAARKVALFTPNNHKKHPKVELPLLGWQVCPECKNILRMVAQTNTPVNLRWYDWVQQDIDRQQAKGVRAHSGRYSSVLIQHRATVSAQVVTMTQHSHTANEFSWRCGVRCYAQSRADEAIGYALEDQLSNVRLITKPTTWDHLASTIAAAPANPYTKKVLGIIEDPENVLPPILTVDAGGYFGQAYSTLHPFLSSSSKGNTSKENHAL